MFSPILSKALELFGRSFLLAAFLPCLIVLAVVMLWLDPDYFLEDVLLAWVEEERTGRKLSIALLLLLATYLVAFVVYGIRNALAWLFWSGRLWVLPALIEWRKTQFIQRRRDLDKQKEMSLQVPQATAWVMAGFPVQDEEDLVYREDSHSSEELREKIERGLKTLERIKRSIASTSILPLKAEHTLEEVIVLLHERTRHERDAEVDRLIARVQTLAGTPTRLNAWCRSIQKRTYGSVATAFSEGVRFPLEKYVQPTLLGNVMSWTETYPSERYGLNLDLAYPRLQKVIDADYARLVEDRRMFFDFAIIFATLCLCAVGLFGVLCLLKALLVAPPVADWYGTMDVGGVGALTTEISWWRGITAVGFWTVASVTFYRIAVLSARSYGIMVHGAVDLYRFQLLEALKIKLPTTPDEEKRIWTELNRSFYESTIPAVSYHIEGRPADGEAPDDRADKQDPAARGVRGWMEHLQALMAQWLG